MSTSSVPAAAQGFLNFVNKSPTPFHATLSSAELLLASGFTKISEKDDFRKKGLLQKGGKYFYTRNQSSIVAFTLPHSPTPQSGLSIVAGHTDSPTLKIRPISKKVKGGTLAVACELYGGGIWATWFDRDLSIAGRVIVAQKGLKEEDATYVSKLINIERPILRIPTLAIHLDRRINDAWKFNKETEFTPILGLVQSTLNASSTSAPAPPSDPSTGPEPADTTHMSEPMLERHHTVLLEAIAKELGCDVEEVCDFELMLYDTQKSCVGGIKGEFILSPRLDNQMTCYCATQAMCEAFSDSSLVDAELDDGNVHVMALFDNEEIGSVSHHGAASDLLPSFISRISAVEEFLPAGHASALLNSFLLSSDMGHALAPNYQSNYEDNHRPLINHGVVIKTNANQRYTSTAATTFLLRRLAKIGGVPLQEFEVRNDSSCGSTIGPMLSATGLRTVDLGLPQWSMHSIRETSGVEDPRHLINLFVAYYKNFAKVDRQLTVD